MLRAVALCACAVRAATAVYAGPTEQAILATMRLSEQANYAWTATVADDARTYDIVGKTSREGYARVRMPVINSVRRALGLGPTETDIELVFRGNVACVIQTEHGWLRPDELPSPDERAKLERSAGSAGPGRKSSSNRRRAKQPPPDRGYSNLQLALSLPHEELGVIVASHRDFAIDGDVVSGTLTELGAQLLLVRDGQNEISPLRAAGSFKLWLRDGAVTKYQVKLEGLLQIQSGGTLRQVAVQQLTDTVIRDIGTTIVDVPAEAKAKLTL